MAKVWFYCESCGRHMLINIEPMAKDDLNGNVVWGDIVCAVCHFVIATVSVEEEGIYDLVKVEEHAASHDPEVVEV